jgi:hypothetical protein
MLRFTPRFHFFSEYAVYCQKRTVLLSIFADNDKFNSALSPKTLKTIRKRAVTNTALLRVFGDNAQPCFKYLGELKNIFKMLAVLRFVSISD